MSYLEEMHLVQTPIDFHYMKNTVEKSWRVFHAHQGMEFLYIHKGSGHAIFDHMVYEVKPGTLLFFQPFQLHGLKIDNANDGCYIRSILTFDPVIIEPYLSAFPGLNEFFQIIWKDQINIQYASGFHTQRYLESFLGYFCFRQESFSLKNNLEELTLLTITFLQYIKDIWQQETKTGLHTQHRTSHYAEKIMQWIEEHYMEEFHLKQLSNDLHLSEYHISHLFHKATGASITQYLIVRRMRQACFLLKHDILSLDLICLKVGIKNTSYFCQLFKRTMGITPGAFRASIKSQQFINRQL